MLVCNQMRIWVTTFATRPYRHSADLLRDTAVSVGKADKVIVQTPKDLKSSYDKQESSRGFGFYAWKPEVIRNVMNMAMYGDWIVYCDSTMTFESSLKPYLQAAGESMLFFRLGEAVQKNYRNGLWTKPGTFNELKKTGVCGGDVARYEDCYQLNASVCIFRKHHDSERFLQNWHEACLIPAAINDGGPPAPRDHRHDQSILTILAHNPSFCRYVKIVRDCNQYGLKDPPVGDDEPRLTMLVDHHRKRYGRLCTTTVITATTGRSTLRECILSVQQQSLPSVKHLVVVDGPQHLEAVQRIVKEFEHQRPLHVLTLPYSVGHSGWNGHRVFGSAPYLCESDLVSFVDDDNTFSRDHLLNMMRLCHMHDLDGAFSLRSIHAPDMTFVCNDSCESLGSFAPSVLSDDDFFVDTSCMMVKRDVAIRLAPLWNSRFRSGAVEADRAFSKALLSLNVRGVPQHTVQYRLGGSQGSVTADFFKQGNGRTRYDFDKPILYVFHFNEAATHRAMMLLHDDSRCLAFYEWQMTLLKGLRSSYNIINGYVCQEFLQPGSIVLANMCNPGDLLLNSVFSRTDLKRICYTLESPNARHAAQWSADFLARHFDVLLTYWQPLLDNPRLKTVPCLHNTHHLDLSNPHDRQQGLRENRGVGRSVCMVLESRQTKGEYVIDGVTLHAQDYLREHYVKDLKDATVFGVNWSNAQLGPGVKVGHSKHRNDDAKRSVDHMQEFTFALIIENCDAKNYVSEKCYDAFSAGSIPLYYDAGNNDELTDIPRDMYVDIKPFQTSQQLQQHIDNLTDDDIRSLQNNIYTKREVLLSRVSVQSHAAAVSEAVKAV